MTEETAPAASPLPLIGRLTLSELWTSLKAGYADYKRAPACGVFFAAFYVIAGWLLIALGAGSLTWTLMLVMGFPLIGPFAAVGFYEISRRLEAGEKVVFGEVLGVVLAERHRQIPWIGAVIIILFLFWSFFAHILFALMLGLTAMTHITGSLDVFMTRAGATLIVAELLFGGAVALLTFAGGVVSLPLAVDREIDFVSAILLSFRAFAQNLGVMLVWGAMISAIVFLALVPAFLGLFVALPVLGHASWHVYRRVLYDPV